MYLVYVVSGWFQTNYKLFAHASLTFDANGSLTQSSWFYFRMSQCDVHYSLPTTKFLWNFVNQLVLVLSHKVKKMQRILDCLP